MYIFVYLIYTPHLRKNTCSYPTRPYRTFNTISDGWCHTSYLK